MKRVLIVGGANGIGLSVAMELSKREDTEKIYVVDKVLLEKGKEFDKMESFRFDLAVDDYAFFDRFHDIDTLVITAGFGKLGLFRDVPESYIVDSFNVNAVAPIRLVKHFYPMLESKQDFFCGIMVSISGYMSSPFFAVYSATKAALRIFIESVNIELEKSGATNRILNVSPGSIQGTSFNGGETDTKQTKELAQDIIAHLERKDDLLIPKYEEVFREVLERYHKDFRAEGIRSYEYKISSGRIH